jgi:hypothetical protein
MKTLRFEVWFALTLIALFAALCLWLNSGNSQPLTHAEVNAYLGRLEGHVPLPPTEAAEAVSRLRAWGYADDGGPVYMLNVMSYYDRTHPVPGVATIDLPPVASNALYERDVMSLLFRRGGYPLFAGNSAGLSTAKQPPRALMGAGGEVDRADRILLVRYPSRRAFLSLVCDPQYLQIAPYKFAALQLTLLPLQPETVIPDPRWLAAGVLLCVFLAVGWLRASRQAAFEVTS